MKVKSIFASGLCLVLVVLTAVSFNATKSEAFGGLSIRTENSREDLEQMKRDNDARQSQLKSQIGDVSATIQALTLRIDSISNYEIPRTQIELGLLEDQEAGLKAEGDKLAVRLSAAQEEKAQISEQLDDSTAGMNLAKVAIAAIAREDIQSTPELDTIRMIMNAENSKEFVQDLQSEAALERTTARLSDHYAKDKAALSSKDARMQAVDKKISDLTNENQQNQENTQRAQTAAAAKLSEITALQAEMTKQEAELNQQLGSLNAQKMVSDAERNQIDDEMAQMIRDEIEAGGGIPSGSGLEFDPGYIISDAKFYTSGTMSTADIQNFLNQKGANCYSNCLKDYYVTTVGDYAASSGCSGFGPGVYMSAAQAISTAASACHISEKVLLVMLQKEQGLITSQAPSDTNYRYALGYGCPDTAGCDAHSGGLFNQLYSAAWQFNYYKDHAAVFRYKPFMNNSIQYHPNAGCGSKDVFINDYATAGLYAYTPYTPNAAAIAAGLGQGDTCSSYGNRNFYYLYLSWFGNAK